MFIITIFLSKSYLLICRFKKITIFFLFSFKMFSKQIIWYLSLISKADNHTSLTKNMNRNCFCKNFVYMNKHCRQLQWLYAKLKTLNKGFETTLLLPNFKRERWKEREMEKRKRVFIHMWMNTLLITYFSWFCFLFGHMGVRPSVCPMYIFLYIAFLDPV